MRFYTNIFLAAAITTLTVGCAEDVPEIYIVQNQIPDDACEVSANAAGGGSFRARGVLDIAVTNSYVMYPLVQNVLVPSEEVEFTGLGGGAGGLQGTEWEANSITLTRAVAEFDGPAALGISGREVEIPLSGSMTPADFTAVELEVIPSTFATILADSPLLQNPFDRATLLVRIKFFGITAAGREVDSNQFTYPIEICRECLIDIPLEAIDVSQPLPNCANLSSTTEQGEDGTVTISTDIEPGCTPGQDEPIDCRLVCATLDPTSASYPATCR